MISAQRLQLVFSSSIFIICGQLTALAAEIKVTQTSQLQQQLQPEYQCLTQAYVVDPSSRGLNIRRKPNLSEKIIGRLSKNTEVNVLGMQGEWILISVVDPISQKVAFRGEGWVYRSLLGVAAKGYDLKPVSLYSQPSFRSKVVGKISPNTETTLLGCSGKWLKIQSSKTRYQGWLEPNQQCAAAYTSCS